MKKIKFVLVVLLIISIFIGCNKTDFSISANENIISGSPSSDSVNVPILMFHDVKTYSGGTWSMSADNFRKTVEFLIKNGYTPISFRQLVDYCDEKCEIPEKPVCLTFDDGYFSNYRNVLPIATEMQIPITVFMICSEIREKGITPPSDEEILTKMSASELLIVNSSPFATVQSHTFAMHGIGAENERKFALPMDNEDKEEFQKFANNDCLLAENALRAAGTDEVFVFSYPGGKVDMWFEEVIRSRGYRVSVTSNTGNKNTVVKGNPETLFLLGRLNVNDSTTEKELLDYLNK